MSDSRNQVELVQSEPSDETSVVEVCQDNPTGEAIYELARSVITELAQNLADSVDEVDHPTDVQLDRFCGALVCPDDQRAARVIEQLQLRGASFNTIYLGYLTGAARKLGRCWEEDTCDFVEMTMAAGRLHAIMRKLRESFAPPMPNNPRHAFFTSVPGESHTLGVVVAADLFRRAGWEIDVAVNRSHEELLAMIQRSNHLFVGLSASQPEMLLGLSALISDVRAQTPGVFIMVSGHITSLDPKVINLIDADYIARDIQDAIAHLEQVRRSARQPA